VLTTKCNVIKSFNRNYKFNVNKMFIHKIMLQLTETYGIGLGSRALSTSRLGLVSTEFLLPLSLGAERLGLGLGLDCLVYVPARNSHKIY